MFDNLMKYLSCLCMIKVKNPELTNDVDENLISQHRSSIPCIYIMDPSQNIQRLEIPQNQFRRYSI